MVLGYRDFFFFLMMSAYLMSLMISDVHVLEQRLTSSMIYFFRFFYSSRKSSLPSRGNT